MRARAIHIILCLLLLATAVSCTKVIEVDVPAPEESLVVEAFIENDVPPYLLLTQNSPYFGGIDLNDLGAYFVNNAAIWVSNGTDTVQLIEYCVDQFPEEVQREFASQFGYSVDSAAAVPSICIYTIPEIFQYYTSGPQGLFVGEVGKTYQLWGQVNDDAFNSTTTIPGLLSFSLSLRPHDDPEKDSLMTVMVTYDDPDTTGNYLRYFTQRNDEPFYPPLSSSVFDDYLIAGGVLTLPVERGQGGDFEFGDEYGYFKVGDTAVIKFSAIDKQHYDFWRTIENDNGDSPFSSPIKIDGNVDGALGIWGGYGSAYDTIIVTK